jgi:hypothetical protein
MLPDGWGRADARGRGRSGWWHYAAALSPSLTAQRNFYCAPSNAAGLVQLVLRKLRGAAAARPPTAAPRAS